MPPTVRSASWPALPYDEWKDTYATLHMWLQVVGKVALAQAPPINHSWAVAFTVTGRGVSTYLLPHGARSFTIEFDFVDHRLIVQVSDGAVETLALADRSVADFHHEMMNLLPESPPREGACTAGAGKAAARPS